ncbi:MAG TPA: glycosyltransferase family 9 protein [bacterium]|nr:glycosyltransferase family 9 protein [bacterium]
MTTSPSALLRPGSSPHILIARPDAIGDVVLTLPVAGWLKRQLPGCRITFLGRSYTADLIQACHHVDEFVDADELLSLTPDQQVARVRSLHLDVWLHVLPHRRLAWLALRAGVPLRVGTNRRWWHWLTANRLVPLSRRTSSLHEAELNLSLLTGIGIQHLPSLQEIPSLYGLTRIAPLPAGKSPLPPPGRLQIILHPKSRGSGREWPLDHFAALAQNLHRAGHQVLLTGTAAEGELIAHFRQANAPFLIDLVGQLTLSEMLALIQQADALVAAGTGPLHLAAALGRCAIGLFPLVRPIHPGRWGPLGPRAIALTTPHRSSCSDCLNRPAACHCLPEISPAQVLAALLPAPTS